jgi:acetolactate synthase-1/2/3 large subunit
MVSKLPYFPEQALEMLSPFAHLILAGAREPVAFFGYAGYPSCLVPKGTIPTVLADPVEDSVTALEALADGLTASDDGPAVQEHRPARPCGELTPRSLGEAIAAVQPEGLIVVDEALTSSLPYFLASASVPPFTYLTLTGGSIGHGLPCAVGAALACPDRRVLAFEADGSGMYTLQALWTMAREGLNITTVICSNRSYRILRQEMARAGIHHPGNQSLRMTELTRPVLDWVSLARGMGVPGVRVETADAMAHELERALLETGPCLIEAVI